VDLRWKAPLNAFQIAFEGRLNRPPTDPTKNWMSRLLDTPMTRQASLREAPSPDPEGRTCPQVA
jgi:hypothetical protein